MDKGLIAIIILGIVIAGAVKTKRCTEFILLGSLLGSIVLYKGNFLTKWMEILQKSISDNAWLWLVCGLFGSLIALLQASKGTFGFVNLIEKFCTTQRKTMITSFVMGVILFVDDYLNVLTIGACMRDIYDKKKIPRESLAFVLDSTAAPVCVLLPFSTWSVFFGKLFYDQAVVSEKFASSMDAYVSAIPFTFYSFFALIIMFLFCYGAFPKLGPMKKAYKRVEETGALYSKASEKYNNKPHPEEEGKGRIRNFVIPMAVLIVLAVATQDVLLAVIVAIAVCFVMYVPTKVLNAEGFLQEMISGFGDMLGVFFLLVAAFSLENVCSKMGLTEYLIDLAKPILLPSIFPAVAFLLLAVLAFVTGSNWGMSAVVIPILIPMCGELGSSIILTMAAILSGAAFGSHACFYTDATVLASNSARIDNMEHATSQWPYVAIAAGVSFICYLIVGFIIV